MPEKKYIQAVPDSFVYKDEIIPAFIFYSQRRSWSLEVRPNGDVLIRVPLDMPRADIEKIIAEKGDWILKHKTKFVAREPVIRKYEDGELIPFFGKDLTISRTIGPASAKIDENKLIISLPEGFSGDDAVQLARDVVILLYRRLGLKVLDEFVEKYAVLEDVEKPQVRIKIQEKRWGSCTPHNGITINARVLLAPKIVAEYLVAHEVVHLKFRHHQTSYWDEVGRVMPEYTEAERLLKEEGWKYVF